MCSICPSNVFLNYWKYIKCSSPVAIFLALHSMTDLIKYMCSCNLVSNIQSFARGGIRL